jgi:hypothetical protein
LVSSRSRSFSSSSASKRIVGDHANGGPAPAAALAEVDEEHDGELEPLGGVHGHQVHGVDRVDGGVGLVAHRQAIDVIGNARQRRVAAVLDAPDQPAELLDVLARLHQPRPAQLPRVARLGDDQVHQVGGRHPVRQCEPAWHGVAREGEHGAIGLGQRRRVPVALQHPTEVRGEPCERSVADPHEP